jgi:hypothetical protein
LQWVCELETNQQVTARWQLAGLQLAPEGMRYVEAKT